MAFRKFPIPSKYEVCRRWTEMKYEVYKAENMEFSEVYNNANPKFTVRFEAETIRWNLTFTKGVNITNKDSLYLMYTDNLIHFTVELNHS